jgi:NNP family nitrate/nitrite transporter-like MFS transporter
METHISQYKHFVHFLTSLAASLFGWMNLFARGLGGYVSDFANSKWAMPGRLWTQTILLAFEGAFILIFANTKSLAGAILVMVFFSIFVQAAEGSSYAIVPYVDQPVTGSISGMHFFNGKLPHCH